MQSAPAKLRANRARDIYGLVEVLENVAERIIDDFSPCRKQWDEARWEASQKKRKLAAERSKNAAYLGGLAGDLTNTLVGIIKPGVDDPCAFVEKGVVKDPVEFTQAAVHKCVLFGWNGVLTNADMCHQPGHRFSSSGIPDLRSSSPCSSISRHIWRMWGGRGGAGPG